MRVADELWGWLTGSCLKFQVVGSVRRRRQTVHDLEILYVPLLKLQPVLFGIADASDHDGVNLADSVILRLVERGVLAPRFNALGRQTFGPKNKLMVHPATGLPVDLFAATQAAWWCQLVCRTGPKESNIRVAMAAHRRGWTWNSYGAGFTRADGAVIPMHSEEEVFRSVGLPYLQPFQR